MRCAFSLRVGPLAGPSCSKRRTIQPNSKRQQKNTTIPLMRLGIGAHCGSQGQLLPPCTVGARPSQGPRLSGSAGHLQFRERGNILRAGAGLFTPQPGGEGADKDTSAGSTAVSRSWPANLRLGITNTARKSKILLESSLSFLRRNFLAIFIVHEVCAIVCFCLQRVSHRLLNEAAVNFLSVPPGVIPDMWSATTNPQIMNFDTGYQQLSILFYILLVPFTALARSFAAGATVVLCSKQQSRCPSTLLACVPLVFIVTFTILQVLYIQQCDHILMCTTCFIHIVSIHQR
mmetsp:Transcript_48445/g.122307  ORF Transcript_48445/g.122307 Transcript_48445/m.122307 type:complete len:289 (-) Transcript_48445:1088-1954(-)